MIKIINGDSIKELKKFPDNYFHSVVTDPPYGLSAARNSGNTSKGGFMGKKWDYDVPSVELWKEVFRVLKEGGYLLSFAGTRTQHRMAVNIEDAGFEIRDMIAWVYGSGFPKSHNIGKAVDKRNGKTTEEFIALGEYIKEKRGNLPQNKISKLFPSKTGGLTGCVSNWELGRNVPTKEQWTILKRELILNNYFDYLIDRIEAEREVVGKKTSGIGTSFGKGEWKSGKAEEVDISIPKTEQAKQWEGWGTALKPALEPITMARKPFKTTVAENVLKNGVGGINIDDCRVGVDENDKNHRPNWNKHTTHKMQNEIYGTYDKRDNKVLTQGRFPANFIHNGSDEVKDLLEESSRFFYCAKASKKDRNEGLEKNNHPTVKPTDLMRYLIRLVTPKNGIVLDCFMGSGSTGKACAYEGFNFVGIDLDKDYCEIAKARIDKAIEDKRIMDSQMKLF